MEDKGPFTHYEIDMNTISDILQVGQEFQIAGLVEACCKIISSNLALGNIKKMTSIAATIAPPVSGPTNLWKHCIKFILKNCTDVLMDTNFVAIAVENTDLWSKLQAEISPSRKNKEN